MKQTTKKVLVLLLAFVLVVTCFPMGAFAADDESGSSGSEIGGGGDGSGNAPGSGASYMISAGITMQVVYYRYDQCYNRHNSHGSVIGTVQNGRAIPWNSTGKDQGVTETTVFDTFTITPHTFLVKGVWDEYPFVYHFPYGNLAEDMCTFTWRDFTNFWFTLDNPGGRPETYPLIVRNEAGGSLAIEQFLAKIILGSNYGAWDKLDVAKGETVATDTSLYAAVLKYLGASDLAIQNYLDSYHGKLSVSQNGDALIPTIIWSWVSAENLGGTNRLYTIGDIAANGSANKSWLSTTYTSPVNCNAGFGNCSWMKNSTDTMICKMMLGGEHYPPHETTIWTKDGSYNLFGSGLVNRIQTEVDSTAENGTNTFYYLRGYWTPYGMGTGSVSLTKTNVEGTENLAGAEFTLYRDAACTIPVTEQDYATLSASDTGYISAGVRSTDASGKCAWTGLYSGIYFLKETKAPEGYRVNTDSSGKVEVKTVSVKDGETGMTLTNAENTIELGSLTVEKYDAVTGQTPQGEATLAGAKFQIVNRSTNAVTVNGKLYYPNEVICELTTDAAGRAQTGSILPLGTYEAIEASAPIGYLLNNQWSKTFTVTEAQKHHSFTYAEKTGCPETVISGKIQIIKKIVNALDNLSAAEVGAKFSVTDSKGNVVDTITTGANGVGVSKDLPYGTYTVKQTSGQAGTVLCDPWTVTVSEHGKVYEYAKENPLWTASVSVHKKEAGTNKPLSAKFELCERTADGTVKVLESGTTNAEGNLVFSRKIVYTDGSCNKSTYFIRETEAPVGYVLDSREYPVSCAENNQIISVTVENSISRARLVIRKLSHKGVPMQGVNFELLKSLDGGTTWEPVGVLATDANGTVVCNGLQVHTGSGIPVLYRVTEMSTQSGSTLMLEPLWQGDLTGSSDNEVVVEAVNAPTFELPHTGSAAGILIPMFGTISLLASAFMTVLTVRRKEQ